MRYPKVMPSRTSTSGAVVASPKSSTAVGCCAGETRIGEPRAGGEVTADRLNAIAVCQMDLKEVARRRADPLPRARNAWSAGGSPEHTLSLGVIVGQLAEAPACS